MAARDTTKNSIRKEQQTMIRKQYLYSISAADSLINEYLRLSENSIVYQYDAGGVGIGNWILGAPGYKWAIIKEVYLNEWSSAQSIRMYNELPKCYAAILEKEGRL